MKLGDGRRQDIQLVDLRTAGATLQAMLQLYFIKRDTSQPAIACPRLGQISQRQQAPQDKHCTQCPQAKIWCLLECQISLALQETISGQGFRWQVAPV